MCSDEREHHERVPQRALVLIDADQTIRYAWTTEDAPETPDFFPVEDALETLKAERGYGVQLARSTTIDGWFSPAR